MKSVPAGAGPSAVAQSTDTASRAALSSVTAKSMPLDDSSASASAALTWTATQVLPRMVRRTASLADSPSPSVTVNAKSIELPSSSAPRSVTSRRRGTVRVAFALPAPTRLPLSPASGYECSVETSQTARPRGRGPRRRRRRRRGGRDPRGRGRPRRFRPVSGRCLRRRCVRRSARPDAGDSRVAAPRPRGAPGRRGSWPTTTSADRTGGPTWPSPAPRACSPCGRCSSRSGRRTTVSRATVR